MTNWYTGVTRRPWYKRICDGFAGIIFGLFLVAGAGVLLSWNEGRSARQYTSLKEAGWAVISLAADDTDTAGSEGRLVHITGLADTEQILTDPEFGVSIRALKLRRTVTIYQWEETTTKHDDSADTYSYARVWASSMIDSSDFEYKRGHYNDPGTMAFTNRNSAATVIALGNFRLYYLQRDRLDNFQPLLLPGDHQLPVTLENKVRIHGNGLYVGNNADVPAIGDLRVRFSVVPPTHISIIAALRGSSFRPYPTGSGGSIDLLLPGIIDADVMIGREEKYNRLLSWGLRGLGFLLMYLGLHTILVPLSVLAGTVPMLGRIVSAGVRKVALLLTAVLSVVIIGIVWLTYWPLLAQTLLALAAGGIVLLVTRLKKVTLSDS